MNKSLLSAFVISALVMPTLTYGETSRIEELMAMDLAEVLEIEIATGSLVELKNAPAVATVITSKDIELMGAQNLSQVLDTVPGMHVTRNGQSMAPRFWFRGITTTYSPQTLIMVNGVSTKSVVRGDNHVVWGEYPIHSIARIEIIRGPGSALYGADAFAGVINIITKDHRHIKAPQVGVSVASFNTQNVWANAATSYDNWQLAANFEYTKSDGFDSIIDVDTQTGFDAQGDALFAAGVLPFDPVDVSLAPGSVYMSFKALDLWLSAENEWLRFNIGVQERRDVGMGQGVTEALDDEGRFGGYKHLYKAEVKPQSITENLNMSGELHYYRSSQEIHRQLKLFPDGAFFGAYPDGFSGNPGWQEETLQFEFKTGYTGWNNHDLTLGMGYLLQNLYEVTETKNFNADFTPKPEGVVDVSDTSEVFMPESKRHNFYFYMQDIIQFKQDWSLTAGIRFDDYSDFGSTVNPRLALVWTGHPSITTKFLYGKAFRAPSFAETITVNNPVALGNPDIQPEKIDSLEASMSYRASEQASINISVFKYEITDLINFVPDFNGATFTAQNVGERSGTGIEFEGKFQYSKHLSMLGNYSYVKATDELLNDDVGEYPAHQAYVRVNWQLGENVFLHAQASVVGTRERIPGDIRNSLEGYESVDLGGSYLFSETGTTLNISVKNLFDQDIREPSTGVTDGVTLASIPNDLPQAGQRFSISLSKTF